MSIVGTIRSLAQRVLLSGRGKDEIPDTSREGSKSVETGEVLYSLLTRPTWVHRQVDAIKIEENGGARRRVSYDLTVPEGLPAWSGRFYSADEFSESGIAQLVLPLGFLEKKVTRGLDVSLEGKSLPVLTAAQNGLISRGILNYLVDSLEGVPADERMKIGKLVDQAVGYNGTDRDGKDPSPAIVSALDSIADKHVLNDQAVAALLGLKSYLLTLTTNYLLLVLVPAALCRQRVVIKYSRDQVNELHNTPWMKKLQFSYDLPLSWRNASHHFELELPSSLEITHMTLDQSLENERRADVPVRPPLGIDVESGGTKAHMVLPSSSSESTVVRSRSINVYAVPAAQGIRKFASWATLAVFCLVVLSSIDRFLDLVVAPEFVIPSTSVSLLLIGPALLFSWLARGREHPMVGALLKPLRSLLLILVFILILMAALAAVPVQHVTWIVTWGLVYVLTLSASIYMCLLRRAYRSQVTISGMIYDEAKVAVIGGSN